MNSSSAAAPYPDLPEDAEAERQRAAVYAAWSARVTQDGKFSDRFFHVGFLSCIILQRFGVQTGKSVLFVSLPVFLALCIWAVDVGMARLRPGVGMLYLALLVFASISTAVALAFPDSRVGISLLSPVAVMLNCALFLFGPTGRFDGRRGIDIFLFYARLCAVAGIAQYALQFVGIRLFAFSTILPFLKPILVEQSFNTEAITAYGSTVARANGLFMLEPSMFSQLLVLAIVIDFFVLRRSIYLPLYGFAYLLSGSGTGIASLIIAMPFYLAIFARESGRIALFGLAVAFGMILLALVLPDQFAALAGRSGEVGAQGSSGYTRYVEQFNSIALVIDETRALLAGFGPGAADRAAFVVGGSGGIIQKVTIDYGFIALLIYMAMLITAFWRWDMAIMPLLALSLMIFGGGYIVFSPIIVLLLMLLTWTRPREDESLAAVSGAAPIPIATGPIRNGARS